MEYIHSKGLVFGDLKPENIAVGRDNAHQVFFFDFAFSDFYVNAMGEPKPREKTENPRGTVEFMGKGLLLGYKCVRKDDFTSLGVILLVFNGVQLPWEGKATIDIDVFKAMEIVLADWNKYGLKVS